MSTEQLPTLAFLGDKYEVVAKMGEGGMGTVYRVHHKLLDEDRVVKLMKGSAALDPTARKRFLREARAAAQVRHPSIAALYDFSVEEDGTSYIIMEYIDGKDLGQVLEEHGAPSLEFGIEILIQGLEAIQLLHAQGWVHRDIAPDNLMLTRDIQGAPAVKLIDLGIVKSVGGDGSVGGATAFGSFVGKARYTAPEQFQEGGSENLKQPSDIYGFGVLAYEFLTGRCPIAGKTFSDVLSNQLFKPPLDFAESDPEGRVPEELRRLILHALEKDPVNRVASADDFLDRMRPFRVQGAEVRRRLTGEVERLLGPPPAEGIDQGATVIIRRDQIPQLEQQVAAVPPPPPPTAPPASAPQSPAPTPAPPQGPMTSTAPTLPSIDVPLRAAAPASPTREPERELERVLPVERQGSATTPSRRVTHAVRRLRPWWRRLLGLR